MKKPNGLILWQGASRIDGAPIVAIVVGLEDASTNSKTGAMLQTYIVRADIAPTDAIAIGADASICGDCTHRGDGTGKERTGYVNVGQGALAVYRAFLPCRSQSSRYCRHHQRCNARIRRYPMR